MFDLELHLTNNDSFQGPGIFRFDFKECAFTPRFNSFSELNKSFDLVLQSLKKTKLLETGAYKWYDNHYGPVVIENIQYEDFVQVDNHNIYQELDRIIDETKDKYNDLTYINDESEYVKNKIGRILEYIHFDKTIFYKYAIEVKKTNIGSTKLVEHNIFDYFYFMIGFNEEKFYLLTLFFE